MGPGALHEWGPKRHVGDNAWMQFPSEFEWIAPNGASLFTSYMPNHYSAGWWFDDSTSAEQAMERAYDIFEDLAQVASTKHTLLPAGTDYTPPNRWVTAVEEAWARRYVWPRFVTGLPKTFFAAVRAELAVGLHPPLDAGFRSRGGNVYGRQVCGGSAGRCWTTAILGALQGDVLRPVVVLAGSRYPSR